MKLKFILIPAIIFNSCIVFSILIIGYADAVDQEQVRVELKKLCSLAQEYNKAEGSFQELTINNGISHLVKPIIQIDSVQAYVTKDGTYMIHEVSLHYVCFRGEANQKILKKILSFMGRKEFDTYITVNPTSHTYSKPTSDL